MLPLPKDYSGIYILTDQEFQEMKARHRREAMLEQLLQVSKEPSNVSITKSTKRPEPKQKIETDPAPATPQLADVLQNIMEGKEAISAWSEDFIWDRLLPDDPLDGDVIENTTDDNIYDYRFGGTVVESPEEYSDIFKSEIAMVSRVLKDVNEISKQAMRNIAAYNKKGAAGAMSKTYADVLSAVIQAQKARTDAIKMISDLKAKQADLTMKARKENPKVEMTVDESVGQFYEMIMDRGRNEFVRNATMNNEPYGIPVQDINADSPMGVPLVDESGLDDQNQPPVVNNGGGGFDLTRPIGSEYNHYFDPDSDATGYIRNEDNGVEVVVLKYGNGAMQFAAIDQEGEQVDDYELPGQDLLDTLSITPMSNTAYDKYSRRYRIIDYSSNVDISDV
ncbi:MAG: hypothetical protein NC548_29725 [Lachnospiraceae bacterium]|nr:hypothetical protein [Lachnospiraceae bacterium]